MKDMEPDLENYIYREGQTTNMYTTHVKAATGGINYK